LHLFLVSEHWLSGTKMQCFASEHWAIGHEDAIFCQRTLGYRARGCIGFASDNWAIGHDDAILCQRTLGYRTQRCKVCASPRLRTEHVVANFSQRKLGYRVRGSNFLPANTGLFRARGMQSFAPQSAGHPGTECMRIRTGTGGWSESSRFADSQNPHGKFLSRTGRTLAGGTSRVAQWDWTSACLLVAQLALSLSLFPLASGPHFLVFSFVLLRDGSYRQEVAEVGGFASL